jgi:hypothetical protein
MMRLPSKMLDSTASSITFDDLMPSLHGSMEKYRSGTGAGLLRLRSDPRAESVFVTEGVIPIPKSMTRTSYLSIPELTVVPGRWARVSVLVSRDMVIATRNSDLAL